MRYSQVVNCSLTGAQQAGFSFLLVLSHSRHMMFLVSWLAVDVCWLSFTQGLACLWKTSVINKRISLEMILNGHVQVVLLSIIWTDLAPVKLSSMLVQITKRSRWANGLSNLPWSHNMYSNVKTFYGIELLWIFFFRFSFPSGIDFRFRDFEKVYRWLPWWRKS